MGQFFNDCGVVMMAELLPCPFCGGEAHTAAKNMPNWTWNWCSVICDGCGAKVTRAGNEGTYQGAEKAAIAAWNTRAEHVTVYPDGEHGIKVNGIIYVPERTCKLDRNDVCNVCDASIERVTHSVYEMGDSFACHPNYCPNCGAKVVEE